MSKKGFYLYAVRPAFVKTTAGKAANYSDTFPGIKGIDNASSVFPLLVGDRIEAIVSHVRLDEFNTEEISRKAQNDLQWIKEKSLLHNQVITQSSGGADGAIVPMKFGLIFKDKESLVKAIKKDSNKFLRLFQKLKGKEEWSVKVFAEPRGFNKAIIDSDPKLQDRKKGIASLPAGLAYFKDKELEDEVEKRKEGEIARYSQEIFKAFHQFVEEAKLGKILGKELTARSEPMILNAILLIHKKKLNKFFKEVEKARNVLGKKGLFVEVRGPWPPYNFI